jgi:hypothetical protein
MSFIKDSTFKFKLEKQTDFIDINVGYEDWCLLLFTLLILFFIIKRLRSKSINNKS